MTYHVPVLLNESIAGLNITPDGIYVDLTFGSGGHSKAILDKLTTGRLVAFDQDEDTQPNALNDKRFVLIHSNYRFFKNFLNYYGIESVNGIIADLGVSWHQFDHAERGFSYRFNTTLDMRMNAKAKLTAITILNKYSELELSKLFYEYGELPNATLIAKAITEMRQYSPITNSDQLRQAVIKLIPRKNENKFMSQLFQALRIEVNDELNALVEMLHHSQQCLCKDGRLVIITYHSIEDRIVKNFLRYGDHKGVQQEDIYGNKATHFELINKKVIVPTPQELNQNKRSRSAKLRIAKKL